MSGFRLLTRTRQITEYSCGACALQAVLSYWDRDVDEAELMKLIDTTSEEGTYPENIVKGARALGFEAEVRESLTLDEVREFTSAGHPMIALGQVWRSESASPGSATEDWDNGHYIVVLGVDDDYVYFQDPYARMSKVFVPRSMFEDHWHQKMGGAATQNRPLVHVGIFIRGRKVASSKQAPARSLASLDFSRFGSLHLLTIRFPRHILPFDFMNEANPFLTDGNVRPIAFICLRKDGDGRLSGIEGGRLDDDEDIMATNAIIAAIASRRLGMPHFAISKAKQAVAAAGAGDFGLSAADLRALGETLPAGHSAIVLVLENTWERKLRALSAKHGGAIVNERVMSSQELAESAKALAEAGRQSF